MDAIMLVLKAVVEDGGLAKNWQVKRLESQSSLQQASIKIL